MTAAAPIGVSKLASIGVHDWYELPGEIGLLTPDVSVPVEDGSGDSYVALAAPLDDGDVAVLDVPGIRITMACHNPPPNGSQSVHVVRRLRDGAVGGGASDLAE